jgi:hypothetical protein
MTLLSVTTSEEALRTWARDWVALLATGQFDEAATLLFPMVITSNGSISEKEHTHWTGALIEAVVGYGGLPFPVVEEAPFARVIPVEESFRAEFERFLRVDRGEFTMFEINYLGGIHIDLPVQSGDFRGVGDLTARFLFKDMGEGQMSMVLEDIHVM